MKKTCGLPFTLNDVRWRHVTYKIRQDLTWLKNKLIFMHDLIFMLDLMRFSVTRFCTICYIIISCNVMEHLTTSFKIFLLFFTREGGGLEGLKPPKYFARGGQNLPNNWEVLYGFDRACSISSTPKECVRFVGNRQSNAASSIENKGLSTVKLIYYY